MTMIENQSKSRIKNKIAIIPYTPEPVCPNCHSVLDVIRNHKKFQVNCGTCGKQFKGCAGFLDLRTHSDRYLSLNQERQKAERLSQYENQESLVGLTRRYYQMTADVSPMRRERFVKHVMDSEFRAAALLNRIPQNGTILEVGSGTGGFMASALLAGRNVTGVDIASRWLVVARKRLMEMGFDHPLPIYPACAERLPWQDHTFDHVVADSLLEHLGNPGIAIAEMLRVVKPGGTILIWSPNRYWPGVDPHVGLFGVGYLSRSWAEKYVAWRRGEIYWPESRSAKGWAKVASESCHLNEVHYQGADFSGWPLRDQSRRAQVARLLGRLSKTPVLSRLVMQCGPVGEIRIIKNALNSWQNDLNQSEVWS